MKEKSVGKRRTNKKRDKRCVEPRKKNSPLLEWNVGKKQINSSLREKRKGEKESTCTRRRFAVHE